MDIFIINTETAQNIPRELLLQYKQKEIHNEKKLIQHCLSYLMVDKILKEVYNVENRAIEYKNKKPQLKTGEKHFSISHSENLIAIGFSDFNCGIDIEHNKDRDFKSIAKRMNFPCPTLEEFYRKWTTFEAHYKLKDIANSAETFQLENYTITALSTNKGEDFNLYFETT